MTVTAARPDTVRPGKSGGMTDMSTGGDMRDNGSGADAPSAGAAAPEVHADDIGGTARPFRGLRAALSAIRAAGRALRAPSAGSGVPLRRRDILAGAVAA